MQLPHLSSRQKWLLATSVGAALIIYKSVSSMKSPYASTSSALPKLKPNFPTFRNIPFKEVNGTTLRLDIYKPLSSNSRRVVPTLVFIHGGSWVTASKNNIRKTFRQYALQKLINNGCAVVSIDYRLADPTRFHMPDQISDCKDALKWLTVHGEEYGLDTSNIGVWGSSAGGHLAMMTVYTDNDMYPGDSSLAHIVPKVNYLIDTFGPTDLNTLFRTNINPVLLAIGKIWVHKVIAKRNGQIKSVTGFDIDRQKDRVRALCREYSPINYVTEDSCPTLIMHGTADKTVKFQQSVNLLRRLRRCKVDSKLIKFNGLRHSFSNATPKEAKDVAQHILDFVRLNYQISKE